MTVKDRLITLYSHANSGILPASEVLTIMQEYYPGDYIIKTAFDAKRMCFCYKPEFDDPKKEMMWRIKYGY